MPRIGIRGILYKALQAFSTIKDEAISIGRSIFIWISYWIEYLNLSDKLSLSPGKNIILSISEYCYPKLLGLKETFTLLVTRDLKTLRSEISSFSDHLSHWIQRELSTSRIESLAFKIWKTLFETPSIFILRNIEAIYRELILLTDSLREKIERSLSINISESPLYRMLKGLADSLTPSILRSLKIFYSEVLNILELLKDNILKDISIQYYETIYSKIKYSLIDPISSTVNRSIQHISKDLFGILEKLFYKVNKVLQISIEEGICYIGVVQDQFSSLKQGILSIKYKDLFTTIEKSIFNSLRSLQISLSEIIGSRRKTGIYDSISLAVIKFIQRVHSEIFMTIDSIFYRIKQIKILDITESIAVRFIRTFYDSTSLTISNFIEKIHLDTFLLADQRKFNVSKYISLGLSEILRERARHSISDSLNIAKLEISKLFLRDFPKLMDAWSSRIKRIIALSISDVVALKVRARSSHYEYVGIQNDRKLRAKISHTLKINDSNTRNYPKIARSSSASDQLSGTKKEIVIQTRHFRSDSQTVNTITAKILGTSQSSTSGYDAVTGTGNYDCKFAFRIWKVDVNGNETEIGGSSYKAQVTIPSSDGNWSGYKSATWDCPDTTLDSTDAILIRIYFDVGAGWQIGTLAYKWISEQLGKSLAAITWTVYYYVQRYYYEPDNNGYFWFGISDKDSRIENFKMYSLTTF